MSKGEFHFKTELKPRNIGYYKADKRDYGSPIKAIVDWEFICDVRDYGVKTAKPIIHSITIIFNSGKKITITENIDISAEAIDEPYPVSWKVYDISVSDNYVDVQF